VQSGDRAPRDAYSEGGIGHGERNTRGRRGRNKKREHGKLKSRKKLRE
jgi:hypothetical protein